MWKARKKIGPQKIRLKSILQWSVDSLVRPKARSDQAGLLRAYLLPGLPYPLVRDVSRPRPDLLIRSLSIACWRRLLTVVRVGRTHRILPVASVLYAVVESSSLRNHVKPSGRNVLSSELCPTSECILGKGPPPHQIRPALWAGHVPMHHLLCYTIAQEDATFGAQFLSHTYTWDG